MVDVLDLLDRLAVVLLLIGIVVASGTYRGYAANENYPLVGGAMIATAIAIGVVAYVKKDDGADGADAAAE